ncbi:MAG: AAA family ATPase [Candidatus Dormibacteraeota bacterium]|nr:AAA family ATPase [Candidatus Dormibacteraeota bacterium]MBO0761646.1 AAA family ATPase [Candidatus Dormibacteraeota bacterium]
MSGDAPPHDQRRPTVADRLRGARRRRFVGREEELQLFRGALSAPGTSFAVLYLHGPGGVGKTSLLGEFADVARQTGTPPVTLDARTIQPSGPAFVAALGAAMGLAGDASPLHELATRTRPVLLLDTYELLAPLDDWVREQLLPALPADAVVVIAGRTAPSSRWVSDPGWHELLRVVSVRNLRPEDTRSYLRIEGVRESVHEQVLTMTHGHPLTLSLLVDAIARQQDSAEAVPRALADAPDVVRALLARVVDATPSPRHRMALETAAHARFTTEELLRAVLGGDDSHELFGWLRTLTFVEEGEQGLYPHDVARDALESDLRWRDPAGYTDLHRRLRAHHVEQIQRSQGTERDRHGPVTDALFLSRDHPIVRSYLALAALGEAHVDELQPGDTGTVLALTRRHQGEEQARYAEYWLERQPRAFGVVRDAAGDALGYAACLALHEAAAADLAADPGVRAMWEYAQRHGPTRPGEGVIAWRFFVDSEPEHPTLTETLIRLWHGREILTRGNCAWDLASVPSDREHFEPLMAHFDFHFAPQAGYEIGGRRYDVYAHDWRRLSVERWLEVIGERELGAPVTAPTGPEADVVVLSEPEFAEAVRAALRDLHHPERLADNPLLRSRAVRDRRTPRPVQALRELLGDAAESLRTDPREESLYRVVDRTFLRPAATQELAAELLDLPFSTYRRYRNRGVQRITSWLWERELSGPAEMGSN